MRSAICAAVEYFNCRYRRFGSRDELLDWQSGKITTHLDWVCANSPFYQGYRGLPLADFPLMNKQRMMKNFTALNTCGLSRDSLFDIALRAEKTREFSNSVCEGVTVGLSSGTSGQRGLFLASDKERASWAGYITGHLLPALFRRQRIALLLRADSPLYQSVGKAHISFHFADLCTPVERWLAKLESFNPTIIIGSVQALIQSGKASQKLAPELVVSGAEVLSGDDRLWLATRFGCDIKEVYQCTEGFLACTHRDGLMRWNEDLVHIERQWINSEQTHFNPVITDFRRRSQPVIRYVLDDVVKNADSDGVFQAIDHIAGRSGDVLVVGGVSILPDLIYNAVSRVDAQRMDYRISQTGAGRILVESDKNADSIAVAIRRLCIDLGVSADFALSIDTATAPRWNLAEKQRRVVNLCES